MVYPDQEETKATKENQPILADIPKDRRESREPMECKDLRVQWGRLDFLALQDREVTEGLW